MNAVDKLKAAFDGRLPTKYVSLVELQPYFDPKDKERCLVGTEQWRRMEAYEREFNCVRVDSGYPKLLDEASSGDNKAWALHAAPRVASERGMAFPCDATDDACDAFLQAVWWVQTHTQITCTPCNVEPCDEPCDEPLVSQCLCCVRKFGSGGLDPSACVTISQLTTKAYKTMLCAEKPPKRVEDAETGIVEWHRQYSHRPRYMPSEGLTAVPREEDQMLRGGMRGGRTDTGATLYEIVNPCRCPVVNGKHVWSETCGQRAKPLLCPACGCGDVREAHRIFSCGECEWMQRAACGVAERIESWDVTSLYPTCLMGDLPVPNATWLTSSEIVALDPETFLFDEEGERHFWVVTCDMEANPTCFYPIVSMK
jgi:hypothetical protein